MGENFTSRINSKKKVPKGYSHIRTQILCLMCIDQACKLFIHGAVRRHINLFKLDSTGNKRKVAYKSIFKRPPKNLGVVFVSISNSSAFFVEGEKRLISGTKGNLAPEGEG